MLVLMNRHFVLICLFEHDAVVVDVGASDADYHLWGEVLAIEEVGGFLVEGLELGEVSVVDEDGA